MKSIIKDIYLGTRGNLNEIIGGEEYRELLIHENKIFDKLYELLTDEQKKLLMEFSEAACAANAELVLENFTEGFKIGLLIGMEVNE